jgi:anti-sigma regulatory factor (Ser/Thr protein kinase)/serine/threonine protein phosphatase PrpC
MAQELEGQHLEKPILIEVTWQGDVREACDSARQLALTIGFPTAHGDEIELAVKELATNLLKHASRGSIKLLSVAGEGRSGIQIEAEDRGLGIADIDRAITDGYSTAGGLGLGLGTVNRLMDEFEIHSQPGAGTHIVCQRWLRPERSNQLAGELEFGAASRPRRGEPENGDAFLFRQWEGFALTGVIDGLGHGVFAQRAAQTGRQYIENHFDQPLDSLFRGVGRACRSTRGVVMALARFDCGKQKLTLASIGNVEMRLFGSEQKFSPVVRRGILGLNAPNPFCFDHPWKGDCVLVLHSDGLSTHWTLNDFPEILSESPAKAAYRLLAALGKPDDDATVVVVRSKRP